MIPLLSSALKENQPSSGSTPAPTQSAASKQAELEAQAKGYELVLQREPDNQTALKGLLESRLELVRLGVGNVKDVIPPLEKLAKLNPQQTDYQVLLAQAKQQVGDREGAAQVYRTILTSKPGDLKALQGLVSLLMQQNRPEAAVGLLEDTLKTATQANQIQAGSVDVTSVQLLLGQVYAEQTRYDEAIAIYDEAIKSSKQDFRPVLAKAIVLKAQGKTEEAKPLFTSATDLAPAQYKDQIKQLAAGNPALGTAPPPSTPTNGTTAAPGTSSGTENNQTPVTPAPSSSAPGTE